MIFIQILDVTAVNICTIYTVLPVSRVLHKLHPVQHLGVVCLLRLVQLTLELRVQLDRTLVRKEPGTNLTQSLENLFQDLVPSFQGPPALPTLCEKRQFVVVS